MISIYVVTRQTLGNLTLTGEAFLRKRAAKRRIAELAARYMLQTADIETIRERLGLRFPLSTAQQVAHVFARLALGTSRRKAAVLAYSDEAGIVYSVQRVNVHDLVLRKH